MESIFADKDGETSTVCWSGSFSRRLRRHQLAGINSNLITIAVNHPGEHVWMNVSHVRFDDGACKWTFWSVGRNRPSQVRMNMTKLHGPCGFMTKIKMSLQKVGSRFEIGGTRGETERALSTGVNHHDTAPVSTTTTSLGIFRQETSAFCAVNAVLNLVDLGEWYGRLRDLGAAASMTDIMFIVNRE